MNTTLRHTLLLSGAVFSLISCTLTGPDVGADASVGGNSSTATPSQPPPSEEQRLGFSCDYDVDCDDGAFCNGKEQCVDGECYSGQEPNCDDGIECTLDRCSHAENNCVFSAPDEDGDGHADKTCLGPDEEPLGDDCDDEDSSRYPGNAEVCSPEEPDHDEDCDPETYGHLDDDLDGVASNSCCNEDEEGKDICGEDCDDNDHSRYPSHPEICDEIDNDCDGEVDVNTREVPWYPDVDGDNFGNPAEDSILSCAPIEGHALAGSDCDDGTSAVHVAAVESCDGVDNDCDGDVDEEGVCACAPNGNVRPCACGPARTGVQACAGGLWGSCNCDECVDGAVDCLAGILPRLCVEGSWVFQRACQGALSECNDGACTCPGGGLECSGGMTGTGGGAPIGGTGGGNPGTGGGAPIGTGGGNPGTGGDDGGGVGGMGGSGEINGDGDGDGVSDVFTYSITEANFVIDGRGTSSGGEWDGYTFPIASASSIIEPDQFTATDLCVRGELFADITEWASVGWNIAQEIDPVTGDGGAVLSTSPGGVGVLVSVDNFLGTKLRVVIQTDETATQQWCAELSGSEESIPWGAFTEECWTGTGAAYDGITPISQILVHTYPTEPALTPFEFCVVDIAPY